MTKRHRTMSIVFVRYRDILFKDKSFNVFGWFIYMGLVANSTITFCLNRAVLIHIFSINFLVLRTPDSISTLCWGGILNGEIVNQKHTKR